MQKSNRGPAFADCGRVWHPSASKDQRVMRMFSKVGQSALYQEDRTSQDLSLSAILNQPVALVYQPVGAFDRATCDDETPSANMSFIDLNFSFMRPTKA